MVPGAMDKGICDRCVPRALDGKLHWKLNLGQGCTPVEKENPDCTCSQLHGAPTPRVAS